VLEFRAALRMLKMFFPNHSTKAEGEEWQNAPGRFSKRQRSHSVVDTRRCLQRV
jgi:hypothetical protein